MNIDLKNKIHFKNYIYNTFKITPKDTLILSISGGVDSMTMLSLFLESEFNLVVVHFNHQKRKESLLESQFIKHFCENQHIPFHCFVLNVPSSNFQKGARAKRFAHLNQVALLYNTKFIVTAHHLDDLSETILLKLIRGSNLYGYAGMSQITNKFDANKNEFFYLKPLLYFSKDELIEFAKTKKITFFEDSSNFSDAYTRNRFRHYVIPFFKKENPNYLSQMRNYHIELTRAFNVIREQTQKYLENQNNVIDINTFTDLPLAVQDDVITFLIEKITNRSIEISFNKISLIKKMLLNSQANSQVTLSKDYIFEKVYYKAAIKPIDVPLGCDKELTQDSWTVFLGKKYTFSKEASTSNLFIFKLCYNNLVFPIRIRTRKQGDVLKMSYGSKKLKDFLIDKKIPRSERAQLILFTDSNDTILWIPNLYENRSLVGNESLYLITSNK